MSFYIIFALLIIGSIEKNVRLPDEDTIIKRFRYHNNEYFAIRSGVSRICSLAEISPLEIVNIVDIAIHGLTVIDNMDELNSMVLKMKRDLFIAILLQDYPEEIEELKAIGKIGDVSISVSMNGVMS